MAAPGDIDNSVKIGQATEEVPVDPIPVCTLFNVSGDNDAQSTSEVSDMYLASSQQSNQSTHRETMPEALPPSGHRQMPGITVSEPALCDIFKNDSTPSVGDDIFSHITDEQNLLSENALVSGDTGADTSSSAMESLRLNRSVDSFTIGDLAENDSVAPAEAPPAQPVSNPDDPTHAEEDVCLGEPKKPMLSSPSFVSITSFSISPDDASEQTNVVANEQISHSEDFALPGKDSLSESHEENDDRITLSESSVSSHGRVNDQREDPSVLDRSGYETKSSEEEQASASFHISQNIEENVTMKSVDRNNHETNSRSQKLATELPTSMSLFPSSAENSDKSGLFPSPMSEGQDTFSGEGDDPFATALSNSELDRRRDAWLPSEMTKSVLSAVVANQKPIKLEVEKLTRPGLSTSELLEDPVKELVVRMTGSENILQRENLTMDDVQPTKEGIKKLVDTGNLRAAANLSAKMLTDLGQGFGQATQATSNTPETFQLWYTRISILTKLRLFEMAATELAPFKDLDNPDVYYEFYPDAYPGRRGSMIPFSFRLLYAEFPCHVDKPEESLRRLHKILYICNKILQNLEASKNEIGEAMELNTADIEASVKTWTLRKVNTLFSIGNTLMQLKDYALAVDVYDKILKIQPEKTVRIQSGIGRIYLHLGDVRAAQQRFAEAEKAGSGISQYKVQLILNRGFMYIGTNNWKEAFAQFEQALNLEPHNIVALNNKAVCMLYLGKLKEAIHVLEAGTGEQTTPERRSQVANVAFQQKMIQGLISNLSTLYELESSRYVLKKRALFLKQIAPTCGDSFDTVCFKEI